MPTVFLRTSHFDAMSLLGMPFSKYFRTFHFTSNDFLLRARLTSELTLFSDCDISPRDWGQACIKLGTKYFMSQKLANYHYQLAKKISTLKVWFLHVNIYFTNQNLMQKRGPMELNFGGIEMQR